MYETPSFVQKEVPFVQQRDQMMQLNNNDYNFCVLNEWKRDKLCRVIQSDSHTVMKTRRCSRSRMKKTKQELKVKVNVVNNGLF